MARRTNLVPGTNTKFKVDIAFSETRIFERLAEDLGIEPIEFAKLFRPISSANLVGEPEAVIVDVVDMRNLGKVEVNYNFPIARENERGNFVDANFVSILPITMFSSGLIPEEDLPIFIQSVRTTGFSLKSPQTVRMAITYRMDKSAYKQTLQDM